MPTKSHTCASLLARINGRTLRNALKVTNAKHQFGKFLDTQWVDVCPSCDAVALGADTPHPWPFACSDGVMRTVEDIRPETYRFESEDLDFCGFGFSRSALKSAIQLAGIEFKTTKDVEKAGAEITTGKAVDVLKFSKMVCDWGQGARVWGNLSSRNGADKLKCMLDEWLNGIANVSDEDAILGGTKISGLGVSFASKHLRMMEPTKYAVLDDVLCKGLGFALNEKGYRLFLHSLRQFSADHSISVPLAELEAGIFMLVRQVVRSTPPSKSELLSVL